jgi:4-hydroxybenzoate polyprenyltransferase
MSSLVPDPDPDPGRGVAIPLIARKLATGSPILSSLRSAASYIRYRESLLLEGAPLLGAAFAIGRLTPEKAAALGVLTVASFFLIVHVFLVNDCAGMTADLRDPNRTSAHSRRSSDGEWSRTSESCFSLRVSFCSLFSRCGRC